MNVDSLIPAFNVMERALKMRERAEEVAAEWREIDARYPRVSTTPHQQHILALREKEVIPPSYPYAARKLRFKAGDLVRHKKAGSVSRVRDPEFRRPGDILCETSAAETVYGGADEFEPYAPRAGDWYVHTSGKLEQYLVLQIDDTYWKAVMVGLDGSRETLIPTKLDVNMWTPILGREPKIECTPLEPWKPKVGDKVVDLRTKEIWWLGKHVTQCACFWILNQDKRSRPYCGKPSPNDPYWPVAPALGERPQITSLLDIYRTKDCGRHMELFTSGTNVSEDDYERCLVLTDEDRLEYSILLKISSGYPSMGDDSNEKKRFSGRTPPTSTVSPQSAKDCRAGSIENNG